jgi:hypothetical protein
MAALAEGIELRAIIVGDAAPLADRSSGLRLALLHAVTVRVGVAGAEI